MSQVKIENKAKNIFQIRNIRKAQSETKYESRYFTIKNI